MPKVRGQIREGRAKPTDPSKLLKWLARYDGYYFEASFKLIGFNKCPKTAAQLGYLFGFLIPEVHEQMVREGHTLTLNAKGLHREIPIPENAVYEIINSLCGYVGPDGKLIRLSDPEMDIAAASKYISGVLDIAMDLKMDVDKLKAKRPKL